MSSIKTTSQVQSPIPARYNSQWETRSYPSMVLLASGVGDLPARNLGESYSSLESIRHTDGFGECHHITTDRKIFSDPITSIWSDNSPGQRNYYPSNDYYLWDIVGIPPQIGAGHLNVTYPKTFEELSIEAYRKFYDRNEVDTLLNILEADQLVRGCDDVYNFIQRFFNPAAGLSISRRLSKKQRKAVNSTGLSRESNINPLDFSNLFLGWSFGFAPLIADLRRLSSSLPKVLSNLRKLAKQGTMPYTATAVCEGSYEHSLNTLAGFGPKDTPGSNSLWHAEVYSLHAPMRVVGIKGTRVWKYQTEEFQILDMLLSRFVATSPIALAWEKVPFSFVIDWFIDLSGLITRMDSYLASNSAVISKSWQSESLSAIVTAVKHAHMASMTRTSIDGQVVAQYNIRSYHRSPRKIELSLIPSGRFGKKQAGLTAALIHQKVANLRRRLRR